MAEHRCGEQQLAVVDRPKLEPGRLAECGPTVVTVVLIVLSLAVAVVSVCQLE